MPCPICMADGCSHDGTMIPFPKATIAPRLLHALALLPLLAGCTPETP